MHCMEQIQPLNNVEICTQPAHLGTRIVGGNKQPQIDVMVGNHREEKLRPR